MRKILTLTIFALFFGQAFGQTPEADFIKENYTKIEKMIPMRDGVKLFTSIYIPKSQKAKYPFLISRTPYTVQPYGEDKFKTSLGNYIEMAKEGFIFVYQDVRGRWMSEGTFADVRPHNPAKKTVQDVDESSDTYDTVDWLIKNVPNNNGRAGLFGISYPGFYSTAALPGAHPGLRAVSPQAPVTDWFIGDDFHHNGAFFLMDAFAFQFTFGAPRPKPITPDKGPKSFVFPIKDNYRFYLDLGALKNVNKRYYGDSIKFWNEMMAHSNYDAYWKARNIRPHLTDIKPAVMVVGGFFDAED
ncbi:MAG: CocE/NonD family hydrolase, partial [Chitinophagaceae bacterium]